MADPTRFTTGPDAERLVADDPFWSTLLRRHADVDVVVLPPQAPQAAPERGPGPPPEPADPGTARAALRARFTSLCDGLGLTTSPDLLDDARLDDVWLAGPGDDTLVWQGTAAVPVDPEEGVRALRRALALLATDGWSSRAPTDGVPRVLAGRAGPDGREEVQVLAPEPSRVVVRVRSSPVRVGAAARATALQQGAAR